MGLWGRLTRKRMTKDELITMRNIAAQNGVDVSEISCVKHKIDSTNYKIDYFINPEALKRKRELQHQEYLLRKEKEMEAEEMRRTGQNVCGCGKTFLEHTDTNLGHVFGDPAMRLGKNHWSIKFQCAECDGETECNNECDCYLCNRAMPKNS